MTRHFLNEIDHLKKMTFTLSALVEENLDFAVKSVLEVDSNLADKVGRRDHEIDRAEVAIEEECLKILALYQPVAADLRFVVAVLKLNQDLERIGDLSSSIAHRAATLSTFPRIRMPIDLEALAFKVRSMVRRSLEALVNLDVEMAREVMQSDDEIDKINRDFFHEIQGLMRNSPEQIGQLLCISSVSRSLERIADHATNVAEDVVYLVEGEIVRHGLSRDL